MKEKKIHLCVYYTPNPRETVETNSNSKSSNVSAVLQKFPGGKCSEMSLNKQ